MTLDAIDTCIWKTAKELSIEMKDFEEVKFLPFDPKIKRTEAIIKKGKNYFRVVKGAPQVILSMSSDREAICHDVEANVNSYASKGFRSIGVAASHEINDADDAVEAPV